MKLSAELQLVVDDAAAVAPTVPSARRALSLLDLTSLNDDDTADRVAALCRRAVTPAGPVAAVCVWPRFVPQARDALAGTPVRVASVVNFPDGDADTAAVVAQTTEAIAAGAHEIDVVLPYASFIEGARTQPLNLIRACREACGEGVVMKVILEAGAFPDADLLDWAARDAINAGADFLKTSTGRVQPAATLENAALILHAIGHSGRPVGFKASGGIRDAAAAAGFLHLADVIMGRDWASPQTFRIGASALLDDLLSVLGEGGAVGKDPAEAY